MKFKFSLQKVMDHRKVKEDLAQRDFQEAFAEFRKEQERLEKMHQDVHEARLRAGELAQMGGAQGPALSQIHEFLKGQKIRIEQQSQKVEAAEKLVEAKREVLRQAAVDYKIMEKMREVKFQAYKEERLSQEQKESDEQSILRFKSKAMKES